MWGPRKLMNRALLVYCCEGQLINPDMKDELRDGVTKLEKLLEQDKDWNLYSNEQTWNLVNPSLYSFIRGVSPLTTSSMDQRNQPIANWIGIGDTSNAPSRKNPSTFQWLPSEFEVNKNGKVRILSYINNLHPYHFRGLYKSIANIFEQFVPQFEECLKKNKNQTTNLKGRKLQVIVKIAENMLTPQKPYYKSGRMHTVCFYVVFFSIFLTLSRKECITSVS